MDYRYLKAFILTAQHLSFSKAAEDLNIAQSAVSRQIKLLEESFGHELIIRSSKKVLLTEKGQELLLATQQFEKSLTNIFASESTATIKIGVLHGLLETWLTGIISEYHQKSSNNLEVTVGSPANLKEGISLGKYDIIFTAEEIQNELITSLKLFNEKLVLISKKEIDLSKINSYTWIVYGEQNHFFQLYKKRSSNIYMVNSITAMIQLVKNNVGIAIVPDHIIRSNDKLIQYDLKVQNHLNSTIYMTTLNYKALPKYMKEFMDLVQKMTDTI